MRKISCLLILLLAGVSAGFAQNKEGTSFAKYIDTLELRNMVSTLASPAMKGRRTGETGQKMAAEYIAQRFADIGLKAAVPEGYFQTFSLLMTEPGTHMLFLNDEKLERTKDYFFEGEMDMAEAKELELVYLNQPSDKALKNLNVKGKAVAIYSPGEMQPLSIKLEGSGAKLIINVLDDSQMEAYLQRAGALERPAYITTLTQDPRQLGRFYIRQAALERLMKGKKDGRLHFRISRSKSIVETENVLGLVEGKDKSKVLVITAHYDHEGEVDGKVFHGADDNASGTAAMMELAQAFQKASNAGYVPEFSILFIAFSGEESGLLGAYHYVQNAPIPVTNHVINLNMDMIGRIAPEYADYKDYVYLLGSNRHPQLRELSDRVNAKHVGLELDYSLDEPEQVFKQSDQWAFAQKGIPALFYFNGVHDDYHQPTDTVDKINFPLLRKRASLVFFTAWEIAFSPRVLGD